MKNKKIIYILFAAAVFCVAMNGGLGSGTFSNYYSEVFHVTTSQRGFIEIPRETPGILCVFIVALLSGLGNIKKAVVAEIFSFVGMLCLGLLTPTYAVMLAFLFIQSIGEHLYMPLFESLSLKFAEPGKEGLALGKYKSIQTAGSLIASLLVFVGFRSGFFTYAKPIIPSYVLAGIFGAVACGILFYLSKQVEDNPETTSKKIVLKKEYIPYYVVTCAYGTQKRIKIVFAPWVIVNLLGKDAGTMALLAIATHFIGVFVSVIIGKMLDKWGVKKLLVVEGCFIVVIFVVMGLVAKSLVAGTLGNSALVYVAYLLCATFDKFAIVHSYLMKSLALCKEDVTMSFSAGLSLDHVVAIMVSPVMGLIWDNVGPQFVFYLAAITGVAQCIASAMAKTKK
ncbi:MAG: MFS transporter [Clostridia bacterium]|nr:MFS transporter [Clostridia bacterium]